jgi:hypothetical protein
LHLLPILVFGRDAGFTAFYAAYVTSIRWKLDKLIGLLTEE